MKAYVYLIFDPDGVPRYVGKGRGKRWLMHLWSSHNLHLARIVAKARKEGRELPMVKIREGLSDAEALQIEIAMIKAIGRKVDGGTLVNLTDGGEGVTNPSVRTREALRQRARNRNVSAAQREANRAYRNTPEGRAASIANLPACGNSGPITIQRREAIRRAVTAFWERRRQEHGGSPPSLRGESGHIKHSLAMRARTRGPQPLGKEV